MTWRRKQTDTYWPKVLLTIAALLPNSGWAAQPWVTEGWSPLSGPGSHSGILSTTPIFNCDWNWTVSNWLKPSVAPGYIIVWHPPASFGRTHLHRIQARPQVKGIFRYLRPDAPVSRLHRCIPWLTARSRVNMLPFAIRIRYSSVNSIWLVLLSHQQLNEKICSSLNQSDLLPFWIASKHIFLWNWNICYKPIPNNFDSILMEKNFWKKNYLFFLNSLFIE